MRQRVAKTSRNLVAMVYSIFLSIGEEGKWVRCCIRKEEKGEEVTRGKKNGSKVVLM